MGFLSLVFWVAMLAVVVGGVMVMVAAFRESVLWGLAYLFLPFANLVFIFTHWEESKAGFFVSLAGLLAVFGLAFAFASSAGGWQKAQALLASISPQATAAPASSPEDQMMKIQESRDRISKLESEFNRARPELTRQFNELASRRQALVAADTAAIAKFNEDAAAYQKLNGERKNTAEALKLANQELSVLLEEQAKSAARRIVMYTTPTCGACKVAKSYFAQKGITYQEIDVTQSPAGAAEFKRLGGRGVPLILIGDKRMEGFNAQALEAML